MIYRIALLFALAYFGPIYEANEYRARVAAKEILKDSTYLYKFPNLRSMQIILNYSVGPRQPAAAESRRFFVSLLLARTDIAAARESLVRRYRHGALWPAFKIGGERGRCDGHSNIRTESAK